MGPSLVVTTRRLLLPLAVLFASLAAVPASAAPTLSDDDPVALGSRALAQAAIKHG